MNDKLARSRAVTRPITKADMGLRTDDLDLALIFDVATRKYDKR